MLYALSPVPQGSESGSARVFKGSPVPAAKGSLGQIHFGLRKGSLAGVPKVPPKLYDSLRQILGRPKGSLECSPIFFAKIHLKSYCRYIYIIYIYMISTIHSLSKSKRKHFPFPRRMNLVHINLICWCKQPSQFSPPHSFPG